MAYQYKGTKFDAGATFARRSKHEPAIFDDAKCGTTAGHKQHRTLDVPPCQPCKDALAAYHREYRARRRMGAAARKGFNPDKCGTYAGYARHTRSDVPPCQPCEQANAEYMHNYRAKRVAA